MSENYYLKEKTYMPIKLLELWITELNGSVARKFDMRFTPNSNSDPRD